MNSPSALRFAASYEIKSNYDRVLGKHAAKKLDKAAGGKLPLLGNHDVNVVFDAQSGSGFDLTPTAKAEWRIPNDKTPHTLERKMSNFPTMAAWMTIAIAGIAPRVYYKLKYKESMDLKDLKDSLGEMAKSTQVFSEPVNQFVQRAFTQIKQELEQPGQNPNA